MDCPTGCYVTSVVTSLVRCVLSTMHQCMKDSSHHGGKKQTSCQCRKYNPRKPSNLICAQSHSATLVKVLESFVGSWILDRLGNNLNNWQYGALRQCSMTHALVDMLHHWHAAIDKGQSVHSVFLDFAKAFDHVDHNILVNKLVVLSLPDVIVRWICAFLQERRQRVKIGDVLSDWLHHLDRCIAAWMPDP